jgi:hypothetical protein
MDPPTQPTDTRHSAHRAVQLFSKQQSFRIKHK